MATPANDLVNARKIAEPGQWIMCAAVHNTNPTWCVMSEQETQLAHNFYWIKWERKEFSHPFLEPKLLDE